MSNSNSNNPFLPHLTEENDNNNGNRNQNNKDNNNTLPNYLEEGSSIAAPPPAYEDVVKPGYNYQHTYSPNNNPSYPPPSYPPPPTASVAENLRPPANFNDKRGHQICCCNFSNRKKACCYGWIVLIIFIILGSISIANNNVCKRLTLHDTPREFLVDLDESYTKITFDVENSRMKTEGIRISRNSLSNETGIKIQVYTGSTDSVTPQFEVISNRDNTYNLRLYQKVGFSLFNIPPRCMIYRFDVILPQNGTKIPNIHSRDLNIKVTESDQQYQDIALSTNDGDVTLEKTNAKTMNITTNDGDITGSIHPLSNSVASLNTNDGDIQLTLNTNETSLNCEVKTDDGRIRINGENRGETVNEVFGNTDGRATLSIITEDGDVTLQTD